MQAEATVFDEVFDKRKFSGLDARPNEIADAIGKLLESEVWAGIYEDLVEMGLDFELQLATFKEELEGSVQPPPYKRRRIRVEKSW